MVSECSQHSEILIINREQSYNGFCLEIVQNGVHCGEGKISYILYELQNVLSQNFVLKKRNKCTEAQNPS
jgi:hypothetical protein